MTNSEYFEKNKISFAEALEIFNKQKNKKGGTKSFDKFLASEHAEHKFKVGDFVVIQSNQTMFWQHNVVLKVIKVSTSMNDYLMEFLTPHGIGNVKIGSQQHFSIKFIDDNCIAY